MLQRRQGRVFADGVIAEHKTIWLVLLTGVAVVMTLRIICRKSSSSGSAQGRQEMLLLALYLASNDVDETSLCHDTAHQGYDAWTDIRGPSHVLPLCSQPQLHPCSNRVSAA